ncbi:alpha/beta-hydrolase [Gigaspora margarita]|uniref:Alpha/beta-hydrolase n=1 Tax=Gigaspora margarita TaxID=4874 RepID=A0A8H4AT34_GIGMA|nr:alpha/beta-hydrolase [Gigaspora margarita]
MNFCKTIPFFFNFALIFFLENIIFAPLVDTFTIPSDDIHALTRRSKSYNPPLVSSSIIIPSAAEIVNLTRFITYSAASYCPNSKTWKCGQLCDNIPQTTVISTFTTKPDFITNLTKTYLKTNDTEAYAVITVNSKDREIVVTFRGTADLGNILKDIEFIQWPYAYASTSIPLPSILPGDYVHYGFYTMFLDFQTPIRNNISTLIKQYPNYQIVVTGHSFGGALALFTALDIKQFFVGINPFLYTYGEPRVGNSNFASFVNNALSFIRRVINQAELVPHIPYTLGWIEYVHHKGEIWIANSAANAAVECLGVENNLCSSSVNEIDWNFDDHFGPYWGIRIDASLCK